MSAPDEKTEESGDRELAEFIGEKIATRREELGLSQETLAERAGMHRTSISPLELGKHAPRIGSLRPLAKALEVAPWELLPPDFLPDAERDSTS